FEARSHLWGPGRLLILISGAPGGPCHLPSSLYGDCTYMAFFQSAELPVSQ
ncbi:hypothetical protein GOODEAATRI_008004, partial [Goodea atripinnis]